MKWIDLLPVALALNIAAGCGSTLKAGLDGETDTSTDTSSDTGSGDGTDVPVDCTSDGECDDSNPCTDDSCVDAACVNAANSASCDDGDPCTYPDTCGSGSCVPGANICGCTTDGDCHDANACTTDRCDGGTCAHGAIDCFDSNPCTDDSCDPGEGCVNAPNSDPCDDGDPCTHPDGCAGGACMPGPELPDWFRDADHDGHGVDHDVVCASSPLPGFAATDGDCCDANPDVHPGQAMFFADAYFCSTGYPSWDYSCDGVEERRWNAIGECWIDDRGMCRTTRGWDDYMGWIPGCGEFGYWIESCEWGPGGWCYAWDTFDRIQECR